MPQAVPSFDAFLSYHSGDGQWVARLKGGLEARGIRVWLDTEQMRPGDLFPGALARAIGAVRCVVIVLSPGSLASAWVEEEYNMALARRCHVIAALIDDVEPPGFLVGRTWVDFRDESQFAASLDHLIFGITGERPPDAAPPVALDYRDTTPAQAGADEAEVLKRLIERRRQDARRLWRARMASAIVGLAIGAVFFVVAADADLRTRLGVGFVAPLILSLAGWGVTARSLTRLASKWNSSKCCATGSKPVDRVRIRDASGCASTSGT